MANKIRQRIDEWKQLRKLRKMIQESGKYDGYKDEYHYRWLLNEIKELGMLATALRAAQETDTDVEINQVRLRFKAAYVLAGIYWTGTAVRPSDLLDSLNYVKRFILEERKDTHESLPESY